MLCTCPYHRETYDDDEVDRCPKCRTSGLLPVTCRPEEVDRVRAMMASIDCCEPVSASVLLVFRGYTAARRLGPPVTAAYTPQQIAAALGREKLAASQRRAMESVHGPGYADVEA